MALKINHVLFCEKFSEECRGISCNVCKSIFNAIDAMDKIDNSAPEASQHRKAKILRSCETCKGSVSTEYCGNAYCYNHSRWKRKISPVA